jgi:hypothetical protein
MPNYGSVSGHGWQFIRLGGTSKYDMPKKLAAHIARLPNEILVTQYYREVQRIAFQARRLMLKVIEESVTETGRKRQLKGGKPGRIKSGDMHKFVWARVFRGGNGALVAQVGWLGGRPGYAIFQEYGTRTGIVAMNALQVAGDYIEQEMDKLGRGGYKYRRKNEWDWDAPGYNGTDLGGPPDWFSR